MLKVCSYPRSGTHLLMASLAQNFDFNTDLSMEAHADGRKWCDGKRTNLSVPWGRLFGSHTPLDQSGLDPVDVLYIMRHPTEVIRSNWEFHGKPGYLNEYATEQRITYWKNHVYEYTQRCRFVTYEDLRLRPVATLEQVRQWFGLKKKQPEYRPVTEQVGWLPLRKIESVMENYNVNTLLRFQDVLGNSFMGYKL